MEDMLLVRIRAVIERLVLALAGFQWRLRLLPRSERFAPPRPAREL